MQLFTLDIDHPQAAILERCAVLIAADVWEFVEEEQMMKKCASSASSFAQLLPSTAGFQRLLACAPATMGVQEESKSLLSHITASKQGTLGTGVVQERTNRWRGSLLGCCSGCDSDAWGSCLLGYFVPCVAFGCALQRRTCSEGRICIPSKSHVLQAKHEACAEPLSVDSSFAFPGAVSARQMAVCLEFCGRESFLSPTYISSWAPRLSGCCMRRGRVRWI